MSSKYLWILFILILPACQRPQQPAEQPADASYKHWLIYNLDIKTFKDSDGNGIGDIKGLTSKLDYLRSLGINTIWLAPFQPSPLKDDGYDVSDYTAIDPKLGTINDLKELMSAAKAKGLHMVMDLVLNHTSIEHPWFRTRTDWYLWSKTRPDDWDEGMGFPGVEKDTWHQDPLSHKYYFHRFYKFEPDLNYQNPAVLAEAKRVIAFWLDQGMDGFRLDAVPFIIDDPRKSAKDPSFGLNLLHALTGYAKQYRPNVLLLGEANVLPEENEQYFAGRHEGLQMMFNFYANQYLFLALATGDAADFKKALKTTADIPAKAQWAWFLRNHDEIDLGRLSHSQIQKVYKSMGPDTNMQLYGRGIRRRLAPMLGNDNRKLQLAYNLLYTLPGTPVIRQGEEIGMGDDLRLQERLAVRTPMQWDSTINSGFSTGKPFRPVISNSEYGYKRVNVMTEQRDTASLLNLISKLIERRKAFPEIGSTPWQVIDTPDGVLAIVYTGKKRKVLVMHNFTDKPQDLKYENRAINLKPFASDCQQIN